MSRKHELFFTLFWSVRFAASSEHSSPAASIPGALRAPYTFWDFVSVQPAVNSVWPELSPEAIWFCRVLFSTPSFFSQRFWEKSFSSNRRPSLLFAECWLLFSPDWCRVTSFVGKISSWKKRQRPRNQKLPSLNRYLFFYRRHVLAEDVLANFFSVWSLKCSQYFSTSLHSSYNGKIVCES